MYVKDDAFFADEVVITGVTKTANILPRAHDTYDLGSAAARWGNLHAKSGHFADNTITLGDTATRKLRDRRPLFYRKYISRRWDIFGSKS